MHGGKEFSAGAALNFSCRSFHALTSAFFVCYDKRTDSKASLDVLGQSVQVRPLQFPMQQLQQTVPVQVPVTASNGQTVYQTVHFPVQALSSVFNMPTTQMIPQITQVKITF